MQKNIEDLTKIYSVHGKMFEEYKNTALLALTAGKRPSEDKTLIIVGGQPGAGKSRLIPVAKQELHNNAIIVDFDELRALHPNYREVSQNYTEITHRILHPDTEKVKDEILKYLIKNNYNVIYEGALRNTQGFVDFAQDFKENNYKIKMNIMAVPKLESYGSTFVRYAMALITETIPRFVEKSIHDAAYEGVIKTVDTFVKTGITDEIDVYVRETEKPKCIYTKQGQQHRDAISAIEYGREIGRKKAIHDFLTKYDMVKNIIKEKQPELIDKLEVWVKIYNEETQYFLEINKGSDYGD